MGGSTLKVETTTTGRNNHEAAKEGGRLNMIKRLTMVRITTMGRTTMHMVMNKHITRKEGKTSSSTSQRKPYMRNVHPRDYNERKIKCHLSKTAGLKVPQLNLTAQSITIKITQRFLMKSIKRRLTWRSTSCYQSKTAGLRVPLPSPINQEEARTIARLTKNTTKRIRNLRHPSNFCLNRGERSSNISPATTRRLSKRRSTTQRMSSPGTSLRSNTSLKTKIPISLSIK